MTGDHQAIRDRAGELGVEWLSMPQSLKSGWVVATGHKRSTGDVFLLAQYEGVGAKLRRQPILVIGFTLDEWRKFVDS